MRIKRGRERKESLSHSVYCERRWVSSGERNLRQTEGGKSVCWLTDPGSSDLTSDSTLPVAPVWQSRDTHVSQLLKINVTKSLERLLTTLTHLWPYLRQLALLERADASLSRLLHVFFHWTFRVSHVEQSSFRSTSALIDAHHNKKTSRDGRWTWLADAALRTTGFWRLYSTQRRLSLPYRWDKDISIGTETPEREI